MKNLITKIEEVHKDKKVIVFDLDGTLAESKMLVDAEMSGLLTELLKQRKLWKRQSKKLRDCKLQLKKLMRQT